MKKHHNLITEKDIEITLAKKGFFFFEIEAFLRAAKTDDAMEEFLYNLALTDKEENK